MNDKIMLYAAITLVVGHWLDLYIMIMPVSMGSVPLLGIWEIASFAGVIALLFWAVATSLTKASIIPINDPYLIETMPKLKTLKFKSE